MTQFTELEDHQWGLGFLASGRSKCRFQYQVDYRETKKW